MKQHPFLLQCYQRSNAKKVEKTCSVEDLKDLLYAQTTVPADRMKILGFPGGVLKDGDDLPAKLAKLKPGAKLQMVK